MDITPPTSVQNVQIQLTPGGPVVASSGGSTPTSSQKAVITWTAGEQDVLGLANSGVAYYQVLVDGAPYDGGSSAGRVFSASWLPHPSTVTLDAMPPGCHAVTVVAVDRATNQSAPSDPVDFISDPDTPTITFTEPSSTPLTPRDDIVSVDASDAAGQLSVDIGVTGGSAWRAP